MIVSHFDMPHLTSVTRDN